MKFEKINRDIVERLNCKEKEDLLEDLMDIIDNYNNHENSDIFVANLIGEINSYK